MRLVRAIWYGQLTFDQGVTVQQFHKSLLRTKPGVSDTIILLEHSPVYTIGIRDKDPMNDVGNKEFVNRLLSLGAEFRKCDRGGLITFHGPGQLVAYPMLDLRNHTKSLRWYICQLQASVVQLCSSLGISANTNNDVGVWVGNNKLAAVGVHCASYFTSHGIAINCSTDLNWFRQIVPCGLAGRGVTSLSVQLSRHVTVEEAAPRFCSAFAKVFNCELQMLNAPTADFCPAQSPVTG